MATPVFVNEEYHYNHYVNLVEDPLNPKQEELGKHLDVGPRTCEHEVHYHMDEIKATPYQRRWDFLTDEEVLHVVECTYQVRRVSAFAAAEAYGIDKKTSLSIYDEISSVYHTLARAEMMSGKILPVPELIDEAEREEFYNEACSESSWHVRQQLLFEFVLEGRISREVYDQAHPEYSEIATICNAVSTRVDEGESLYNAWHGELYSLGKHAGYVYGVIAGDVVADNEFALKHMCSKLTLSRTDLAPVLAHFRYLQEEYDLTCYGSKTDSFMDLEMNAEIISRAPYLGSDEMYDKAFELWQTLMANIDK
jgi:hypothetical protein